MMKRILIFTFVLLMSLSLSAQDNTIRLTVSGEGANKEEATANALRSAIEQAFGTFVSANTQILNDDIVKDEIATISSGNIQEYSELGCITLPNGHKSVSLSATVSIGNLVSYAKSKGSSAEFAGSVFAMNMKMRKLNKENERIAVNHLIEQLEILSKDMYRIEMNVVGQPMKIEWDKPVYSYLKKIYQSQPYFIDFQLRYYSTPICKLFYDVLFNSLKSISLSEEDVKTYRDSGEPIYGLGFWQSLKADIQIFEIGRENENQFYLLDDRPQKREDFTLSVYYFRNDIVGEIVSSIYKFFLDAQLSEWQIVRMSTTGTEEAVTFESIDRDSRDYLREDVFHKHWKSYPTRKPVEGVNTTMRNMGFQYSSFPFVDIRWMVNQRQIITTSLQRMQQDANVIATCNIKIGFTEEELMDTNGFEIKKKDQK